MGWIIFIIWVIAELAARFWPLRIILLALPVLWLASLELEHRKRLRRARKAAPKASPEDRLLADLFGEQHKQGSKQR